jgi:hypothetical protein
VRTIRYWSETGVVPGATRSADGTGSMTRPGWPGRSWWPPWLADRSCPADKAGTILLPPGEVRADLSWSILTRPDDVISLPHAPSARARPGPEYTIR